jgi:hypothetical protein
MPVCAKPCPVNTTTARYMCAMRIFLSIFLVVFTVPHFTPILGNCRQHELDKVRLTHGNEVNKNGPFQGRRPRCLSEALYSLQLRMQYMAFFFMVKKHTTSRHPQWLILIRARKPFGVTNDQRSPRNMPTLRII